MGIKILPKPFATQVHNNGKWNLYRIRDYVLYIGRYRGERDFRLIHRKNHTLDTFGATRKEEPPTKKWWEEEKSVPKKRRRRRSRG